MPDRLTIYYTPKSKETLKSVYKFITQKFGKRSADKFILKAEKTIALITKQCSLFYRVTETSYTFYFFGITVRILLFIKNSLL